MPKRTLRPMTRRLLWLFAVVLTLIAVPAFARRRAVTPGDPAHCVTGALATGRYATLLAADDDHVYYIDGFGTLSRLPKSGGVEEMLTNPFEDGLRDWLPMSMEVDATHVYIGALPVEAIFSPMPGAILTMPKDGGVPGVLVSGVITPIALALDQTHVYWASVGTLDFPSGSVAPDGKIERVTKDGATRETLAEDLSAPLGLALDGNDVYFGESGIADGDPSFGLYRVAKNGGEVATVYAAASVGPLAIDGNTIVIFGASEEANGILAIEKSGPPVIRELFASDLLGLGLGTADRRVYFLQHPEHTAGELAWVSIDAPSGAVVVSSRVDGDEFLLDGCAAILNTVDGDLVRTAR